MNHSQSYLFKSDPFCMIKTKLTDFFVVSNKWFLITKKATLKRWGKTYISLQQFPGNLSMILWLPKTAAPAQCSWRYFLWKNRNYLHYTTQQWEMKTHVPFLLRVLRTGSKSDIYFGNKACRENSAECFQIYRRLLLSSFVLPFPLQGNSSGSCL